MAENRKKNKNIIVKEIKTKFLTNKLITKKKKHNNLNINIKDFFNKKISLTKYENNPILNPDPENDWENVAVFNPAAIMLNEKIYLLYRSIGSADNSTLGLLESNDGEAFNNNSKIKFYSHKNPEPKISLEKIKYYSGGGGNGGCEDPRLVCIDDEIILTYSAFNGWDSIRMTLSKISKKDFLNKIPNWSEPVYLSPSGQLHKNWVLFPEKINGKYVFLHSINPSVMIEYFESLDFFDGDNYIHSIHRDSPMWNLRDKHIRGVGPPPIKTEEGWLVLYHGMSPGEMHRYKLFAMLLDLNNPNKILFNYKHPILEPTEFYENGGIKPGIVYSCGAVVKDDDLLVYYGGSDNFICLAKIKLHDLLNEIKESSLSTIITQKTIINK